MKYKCSICGEMLNLHCFKKDKSSDGVNHYRSYCLKCNTEKIKAERKWIDENQKYDTLAIYGRIRLKQNTCMECHSKFFVLSPEDDSAFCPDCRDDRRVEKEQPKEIEIIFHSELNQRTVIARHIRLAVYERDDYKCVYCDRDLRDDFKNKTGQITLDHFVPFIGRGEDQIRNLFTACRRCNISKYSKLFNSIEEVREYIQGKRNLPFKILDKTNLSKGDGGSKGEAIPENK